MSDCIQEALGLDASGVQYVNCVETYQQAYADCLLDSACDTGAVEACDQQRINAAAECREEMSTEVSDAYLTCNT